MKELDKIKAYLQGMANYYRSIAKDPSESSNARVIASIKADAVTAMMVGIEKGRHLRSAEKSLFGTGGGDG